MTVLAHIGRDIDKKLITAMVHAGLGQRLVESLGEVPGVLSISHHHARGVGSRRVRSGQLYFSETDVVLLLVETEFSDAVFARVHEEGGIGQPGGGMVFMEKVLRGHPMLPFDGADW